MEGKEMKMKWAGVLLIVGMVVFSAVAVFTGTAVAEEEEEDPFRIYGTITDADGNPNVGNKVTIKKQHNFGGKEVWRPLEGNKTTA